MYKFTTGIVVFDEKTRDDFIKAGYKLADFDKPIEMVVPISNELNRAIATKISEGLNEDTSNDGTIEEKSRESKKVSK